MKTLAQVIFILIFCKSEVVCQPIYSTINQGNIWMMSDSIGLNFNFSPPKAFESPIPFPDFTNAIISDTLGRLKYYDKIQNFGDQIVMNRDSQWIPNSFNPIGNHQSITWFLPFLGTSLTGYVTFDDDLGNPNHYAMGRVIYNRILDTLNQGKGGWYGTMNLIVSDFDSMRWWSGATVRHANGRDWWVASHRHGDDTIFVMLATPDTMTMAHRLRIGSDNCIYSLSPTAGANGGEMIFSPDGSRLLNVNGEGLVEVYDFDRCTGLVSNAVQLEAPLVQNGIHQRVMYAACFSYSGRYIYTSQKDDLLNKLEFVQYDLHSTSPGLTRFVVYTNQGEGLINSRLGPDKKIYLIQACHSGFGAPCIQLDSTYLAVINYPDSGGIACQLNINAIPMGRYVNHNILSMAPNYDLGPIDGSPCDTLNIDTRPPDADTTVKVVQDIWPEQLKVYPNPVQEHVIIESGGVLEVNAYHLYDLQGKLLQASVFKHPNSHVEINTLNIPPGHYVLEVLTSQGVYRRKLVKVE